MRLKIMTVSITLLICGLCYSTLVKADVAEGAHHVLLLD